MLLKIRSTFRGSLKPLVTVPEPVDYRDKRIDVMEWMAAHGNSTAYDWLKLHEPEIAAIFDEPDYSADIGALDGDFEPVPRLDEYEEFGDPQEAWEREYRERSTY